MKNTDYPGIQQGADLASTKSQSNYLICMKLILISSIFAAALSIYNFQLFSPKKITYILSSIILLVSFVLTIIVKIQKFEDSWYQGRALAESAKTLTWRYVTCSYNYENTIDKKEVQKLFLRTLDDLTNQFPNLKNTLDPVTSTRSYITNEMERVRQLDWQVRLTYYISNRIIQQKEWYTTKSTYNLIQKERWFYVILASQFLTILVSTSLIINLETPWNLVGLFTTLTSTAIAWLELKQHSTLNQAYTTAALELAQIETLKSTISSERELAQYVLDSENAISREHTTWLAQKRK